MSNLTISCQDCNQKKNNLTASEFGHPEVQRQALAPLKDAAAVNAARYAIGDALKSLGLPVSFWSGGRTKFNRTRQGYPKAHWIDAACVGELGEHVRLDRAMAVLQIKAVILSGKKAGTHTGKVAVRTSGYFNVSTDAGVIQGISNKYCSLIHRADGYAYPKVNTKTGAPLGNELPSIRALEVS